MQHNWMRKTALTLTGGRPGGRHLPDSGTLDPELGWYRRWYFEGCLSDEIARARKSRRELTLIYGRLPISSWDEQSRLRVYVTVRLGLIERETREAGACFGRISVDEFAVFVPDTDSLVEAAAAETVERQLRALSARTAVVVFPDDGSDRRALLDKARAYLDAPPHNVVDVDGFGWGRGQEAA